MAELEDGNIKVIDTYICGNGSVIFGYDALEEMYRDRGVTKVVGIESRGFIGGSLMAARLGAGFVPIRKPGKLPAHVLSRSYEKEYE